MRSTSLLHSCQKPAKRSERFLHRALMLGTTSVRTDVGLLLPREQALTQCTRLPAQRKF
jgi:hypothetical protein